MFRLVLPLVLSTSVAVAEPLKSIKPLSAPREVDVSAVYFTGEGSSARGGTTVVKIRLSPNASREPSVGVMEEFSGGTGDQWRTAIWQAAFAASAFNRVSLNDYEFLVRVGGHIDGPSAGLLMAASFAALQRGQALRPHTTMTGTINPDGSSGPVGGIVQKMRGAAAMGFKRFGYPTGGREQLDVATGAQVDLLALAEELGIEARELRTLPEAYQFLTGEVLPARPALAESDMDLSVAEASMLRQLINKVDADRLRALQDLQVLLGELEDTDSKFVKAEMEDLERRTTKGVTRVREGRLVSGYFNLVAASSYASETASLARFMLAWRSGDYEAAARGLSLTGDLLRSVQGVSAEVDAQFPAGTIVDDAFAFDVLEDVQEAMLVASRLDSMRAELVERVRRLNRNTPAPEVEKVFRVARGFAIGRGTVEARLENARRFMAGYASVRPAKFSRKSSDPGEGAQALYGSGAASMAYFDALILQTDGGQRADDVRAKFSGFEPMYGDSRTKQNFLAMKVGSPRLRFVFSYLFHQQASWLTNKYYSLNAVPRDGVVTIGSPRALTVQFEVARTATLESCHEAAEVGWVPVMARVHYNDALEGREGNDAQKLNALFSFWRAKFWCDYVSGRIR